MASKVFKLSTAGTTNLTKIADQGGTVTGMAAVCTAAYAIFVKLYWYIPTAANPTPTVGTTVPDITFLIPTLGTTTGGLNPEIPHQGVSRSGQLWMAVTKLPADSDATAVVAGDGLISLFYEG